MEAAFLTRWQPWLWSLAIVAATLVVALVVHRVTFSIAKRVSRRTLGRLDDSFVRHGEKPARLMLPLLALLVVLPILPLSRSVVRAALHFVELGFIASVSWFVIALTEVFEDLVSERHPLEVENNLSARRIVTQVRVLRRIAMVVIIIVTAAVMLETFPQARSVGQSLFASAGLAALVVGLAARTTLGNLIAGIQIAITQPIRLQDVVIVEGEWGWIEEIGTTYVVVRVWDLRRLVVPLSYFIEKPFQNWTRNTSNLLATVLVYTDYAVPVAEVRGELQRILQSSGMWDGETWGLQVTNATEHAVELRALMSAADSSRAWDLRCHVREQLIRFLQERYPESLPRTRTEVVAEGAPCSGSTSHSPTGHTT